MKAVLLGGTMAAALALAGCSSSGGYRVASVGDAGSQTGAAETDTGMTDTGTNTGGSGGTGGAGTGSGGSQTGMSNGVIAAGGNAVIGVAGKHAEVATLVNGAAPGAAPVTGTVTAVLRNTGQAIVDIGNGRRVTLNTARALVGDVVRIDLGRRTVVAAPGRTSLIGVGVLSPTPVQGSLAAVNAANGVPLTNGVVNGGTLPGAAGKVTSVTTVVTPVTAAATGAAGLATPAGSAGALVTTTVQTVGLKAPK